MNPTLDAFLRSWPFAPWLAVNLLISGAIYLRGWRLLHRRDPERWHFGRPAAFSRWAGDDLSGPCIADRTVRLALAASSHGAAHAAHDDRPAAYLARLAALPGLARPAATHSHLLGGTSTPLAAVARCFRFPHSPICGVADLCWHDMAVAHAARIRVGAKSGQLARCRTCMFLGKCVTVLVSRRASLSESSKVVALAVVSLSTVGRLAEYCARRLAVLFAGRALSVLFASSTVSRNLSA